jgi:hypothetical protein
MATYHHHGTYQMATTKPSTHPQPCEPLLMGWFAGAMAMSPDNVTTMVRGGRVEWQNGRTPGNEHQPPTQHLPPCLWATAHRVVYRRTTRSWVQFLLLTVDFWQQFVKKILKLFFTWTVLGLTQTLLGISVWICSEIFNLCSPSQNTRNSELFKQTIQTLPEFRLES